MGENSSDYALVEGEAEKVAKEAVKALKESRRQYMLGFNETSSSISHKARFGKKSFRRRPGFGNTDENKVNIFYFLNVNVFKIYYYYHKYYLSDIFFRRKKL